MSEESPHVETEPRQRSLTSNKLVWLFLVLSPAEFGSRRAVIAPESRGAEKAAGRGLALRPPDGSRRNSVVLIQPAMKSLFRQKRRNFARKRREAAAGARSLAEKRGATSVSDSRISSSSLRRSAPLSTSKTAPPSSSSSSSAHSAVAHTFQPSVSSNQSRVCVFPLIPN